MKRLVLLFCLPNVLLATPHSEVKHGNAAADTGNVDAAQYHFIKALEQGGDSSIVFYNMGNALYDRKEFEKASQLFSGSIDTTKSDKQLESSFYNLGNSFFESQKYDEAIKTYIESLKRDPKDVDAKHNLEIARRMLQQQQQEQQQQQQNQDKQEQQPDQQKQEKSENQQEEKRQDQQQQQQQQEEQKPDEEEQEQQPQTAQQMTQEEAERLLNALLQDEQETLQEVRKMNVQARRPKAKQW